MNKVSRKKNDNFTIISNVFLRDKELSIKAKGFLAVVMGLPDSWEFTINGICQVLKEGKTSIYNVINELKEKGYCKTETCRNDKGVILGVDYSFFEEPNIDEPHLDYPHTESPNMDNQPQLSTNITKKIKNKEEDTKKETSQDIVTFWNDKTSDFPKVRKVSDDINVSIKKLIARKYTYEDIKKAILLCNSLDDFYKGRKKNSNWKATLQWLLANTNKNFDKILNGALHTSDTQQKIYDNIMSNSTSNIGSNYNPKMDGFSLIWLESEKCYMTPFDFSMLNDGYTESNRPSSAVVMYNGLKYQWNTELKDWRKI